MLLPVQGQSVRQSMAYDAWGALRNPSTGEAYAPDAQPELLLGRGYTGHEHLPEFGLVNMNARLYDPALGRFLNPDPEVQLPDNTQSYNRYTYCLNNPLRYADPTGMFNQLPPQYKQRHLDPDTYDGEMIYELVVTGYRPTYWKGCGVFAPNAPYVDNYAFVLSNRYGQPQSPLPYGYGAPMGGGYAGAINSQTAKKLFDVVSTVSGSVSSAITVQTKLEEYALGGHEAFKAAKGIKPMHNISKTGSVLSCLSATLSAAELTYNVINDDALTIDNAFLLGDVVVAVVMLANPASIPVAVAGVAYYVVVDVIIKNEIEK